MTHLIAKILIQTQQILTGSLYLATGDKYQGDWKDGKRQGKGMYHYKYVNFLTLSTTKV